MFTVLQNEFSFGDENPKFEYINGCFKPNRKEVKLESNFQEGQRTYLLVVEIDWIGSVPEKVMTLESEGPEQINFS